PATHARILDEAAKVQNAEAILWRIEKRGVAPSHLMGTMHVSDVRITTLSPAAAKALDGSKSVLLEVADLSPKATVDAITKSAQLMMFTDGRRLDKLLSPDDFAVVQALVAKSGLPGDLATVFRPWLVNTLMAVSECERKNAEAGHPVLDSKIGREAEARKIKVIGLETIESQLAAMSSLPDAEQVEMLRAGLKYAARTDDMLETLTQMYVKRRMGAAMPFNLALAATAGVSPDAFKGFQQQLLDKRNRKMLDGARPLLEKGAAFVAVGALHLSGPTGLVQLLRDDGYTVTAVD
ncbi:MAG: TraB/GumN family protein, partial [Hyphomicrobium sp.]